jgi:hypothetical protein
VTFRVSFFVAQHRVEECSACSSIAVGKGVDGFELGVGNRCRCEHWPFVALDELHEIVDCCTGTTRRLARVESLAN